MKLHLTTAENTYLVTAYGTGFVEINKQKYMQSLVVMANQLILDWQAADLASSDLASLNAGHFEQFIELNPEVVLLGTGERHQFLHPSVYQILTAQGIPLECMTTTAACRTYNILMSEGRNAAAALLV
jgi:uncharacterized protein